MRIRAASLGGNAAAGRMVRTRARTNCAARQRARVAIKVLLMLTRRRVPSSPRRRPRRRKKQGGHVDGGGEAGRQAQAACTPQWVWWTTAQFMATNRTLTRAPEMTGIFEFCRA